GTYGKQTLGIYVVHFLFIEVLRPMGSLIDPLAWELLFTDLVFCLSLATIRVIMRTRLRSVIGVTS
ncbi:MAG TPA: hypothetical protein VI758_04885, partial [Bacteroidota bacterium]